jgi:TnpA family transposase
MDDPEYRRDTLTQLNRGETENGLERIIMYGRKGGLYKTTREGQEDQLNALGLVSNIIVVWNTIYMQAAIDAIKKMYCVVNEDDKKQLSPLCNSHINIVGH